MVYPGRPSHGCLACISRKVKCDEGKPGCQRCKKREEPCPGYRSAKERRFVRMTGQRRASTALSTRNTSVSSRPSSEASLSIRTDRENISPTPPLHPNLGDQAVCLFFRQYVLPDIDGSSPGWLEYVPELFAQSNPEDALAHSVKAISYVSLSSRSSIKALAAKGHAHYRTTLKRVSRMLESPEETLQDSLIVAIMLLVLFENHTCKEPAIMMNHARGLHSVLLHRGPDQLKTPRGYTMFRQVLPHAQARNIVLSMHPSPRIIPWLQQADKSDPAAGAIWEKHRISQIRASAADLFALPSFTPGLSDQLAALHEEALNLDAEIAVWEANLPSVSRAQTWRIHANGTATNVGALPDAWVKDGVGAEEEVNTSPSQYIQTYTSAWFSSFSHGHLTSRLFLAETILSLSRSLSLPFQTTIPTIHTLLQSMIASIAFSLGDVSVSVSGSAESLHLSSSSTEPSTGAGAYFLTWSLWAVLRCEFSTEEQKREASDTLRRIGYQWGIEQAVVLSRSAVRRVC